MKFLTDENVSKTLVMALRARAGFDVLDVKEEGLFGVSDTRILEIADKENRIVITHDKDFLNISKQARVKTKGIIILRFSSQNPRFVVEKFLPIITSKLFEKFKETVAIVSDSYIELIK